MSPHHLSPQLKRPVIPYGTYHFRRLLFATSIKSIGRQRKISKLNCMITEKFITFMRTCIHITFASRIENGVDEGRVNRFLGSLDKLINADFVDVLYYRVFEILQALNYTSETLMLELMEPCTFMMQNCSWLGKYVPCATLFRISKSSEGYCCSFNYKGQKYLLPT